MNSTRLKSKEVIRRVDGNLSKRDMFIAIKIELRNHESVAGIPIKDFMEWLDLQIDIIDKHNEYDKLSREDKKEDNEALLEFMIDEILTGKQQTIYEIANQIEINGRTLKPMEVVSRLTELYNRGLIEKAQIRRDGKRVRVYWLKV